MTRVDSGDRAALLEAGGLIHPLMASGFVADDVALAEVARTVHEEGGRRVTEDCPMRCLQLSARTHNALRRSFWRLEDSPATVGGVLRLLREGRLLDVQQIGPRAAGEVKASLSFAGLNLADHDPAMG